VLAADTVGRLAREPRVLGIKDSAGDFEAFQKLLAIKRERPHFQVLQGHEALGAASLLQGGDGMVPGMANLAPALFVSLQAAAAPRSAAECARLQQQITALARIYQQGPWLAALKAACAMLGLGNGRPAPPLGSAAPAARQTIAALLDEAGLKPTAGAATSR
jgi:4-hydroxy-tetrahydrodipicolinate synthase